MANTTLPGRINKLADGLERDRREPDKVLLYVSDLRRIANDLREVVKGGEQSG